MSEEIGKSLVTNNDGVIEITNDAENKIANSNTINDHNNSCVLQINSQILVEGQALAEASPIETVDNGEYNSSKPDIIDPMVSSTNSLLNNLNFPEENADATSSYEQEITRLHNLLSEKECENSKLEQKLIDHEQQSKIEIEQLHQNFTLKLEQTLKKFQDSQKDKTSSMVMKYADAEKRCIDLNQKINLLQTKLNDSSKEKLHLNERLAKFKTEIENLNLEYDLRIKDIIQLKKDNEKIKEQLVLNDAKEKAGYIKYRNELELHNTTRRNLEQANLRINELSSKITDIKSDESEIQITNSNCSSISDVQVSIVTSDGLNENTSANNISSVSPSSNLTSIGSRTLEKDRTIRELYALKSQLKDM
jgi:hypothetical protein